MKSEEIERIEALASAASFVDGKLTATAPAKDVKNNWQIASDSDDLAKIRAILDAATQTSPLFNVAALPKTVCPFVVSRYEAGNHYGWHVDSPMMADPPVRTDLAMTVFLSAPQDYEGGELLIQSDNGVVGFKPDRGDAILYPCQYLHCVNEVKQGRRLAAVTWIQSIVKSPERRQILFQLNQVHGSLSQKSPMTPEVALLLQTHSNLFRMWSEL